MFEGGGVGERVGAAETKGVGVGYKLTTRRLVEPVAVTTGGESELLQAAAIAPATIDARSHLRAGMDRA